MISKLLQNNWMLIGCVFFVFLACSNTKNAKPRLVEETSKSDTLIYIKTGACFGRCPMEEFMISSNGFVHYTPNKFSTFDSAYVQKLSKEKFNTIRLYVDSIQSGNFKPKYPKGELQVADLPQFRIRVLNKMGSIQDHLLIHSSSEKDRDEFRRFMAYMQAILKICRAR